MSSLLVTPETKDNIAKVLENALANPRSLVQIHRSKADDTLVPGNQADRIVAIPYGYKCVYSVDATEKGLARHLSVSVNRGKFPPRTACEILLTLFGFDPKGEQISIAKEPVDAHHVALNFLQIL